MALTVVDPTQQASQRPQQELMEAAIIELQRLKGAVVNGATAVTNIPVAGIAVADKLVSVVMYAAGVPSDVTAEASITSPGNIQLSTTNSTSNKLVIHYFDVA